MIVDHVLVADGNITLPQINHSLSGHPDGSKLEIERLIKALHNVGYVRFFLYETINDHKLIASYTVEVTYPVVHMKNMIKKD